MSSDLLILSALRDKQKYRVLGGSVPTEMLSQDIQFLLNWWPMYWKVYPEHEYLEVDSLVALMKLRSGYSKESLAIAVHQAERLNMTFSEAAIQGVVQQLTELELSGRAGKLISAYNNGEDVDLTHELAQLSQDTLRTLSQTTSVAWIDDSIEDILASEGQDYGLKFPTTVLREHISGILGGASIAIGARPDKGKCLGPLIPIRLSDGSVKLAKDVQVGDVLAGPFRNNTVLGTCTGTDEMFKVTYPWGESYTVNSEHVLSLKRSKVEGPHKYGDVLNVPVREYLQWPASRKDRYKGWKSGIELPATAQQMHAYVLGLWLGDGGSAASVITSADPELIAEVVQHYGTWSSIRAAGAASTYYFSNGFKQDLRAIGVLGNKHVPEEYMRGSSEQRKALLAGLIDSDGYVGDSVEIVSKWEGLANQIVDLARSVGYHATVNTKWARATNSEHTGDTYYRVRIGSECLHDLPLKRKAHLARIPDRPSKRKGLQFGITVEPVGAGPYAGFSLDGDHLFLLGDYTVTHNTSFISFLLQAFAKQLDQYFDADRPILWINNEGKGQRIIPRIYQAALGVEMPELIKMSNEGKLRDAYTKAVGRVDRIRVKDMHGASLAQIETVIEAMQPCVVVWDMLANVRGGGSIGGNKADEVEAKWQMVREMAVRHDFVSLATVQVSAEGGNMLYPPYSAMKDSKTGIQGATDIILMLGALDDQQMHKLRGISTPKNKFQCSGKPGHVEAELVFEASTCQFRDGS